jgi:CBS domain containing-hemolysin-like protein
MSADLPPPVSRRSDYSPWNYLLLIPIVLPLLTFLYNSETPKLFGIPFFYWFQMLLAPLAVLATVSAFYLARRSRRTQAEG